MNLLSIKSLTLLSFIVLMPSCVHYDKVMSKPQIEDGIRFGRRVLPDSEMEPFYFTKRAQNIDVPGLESWADRKAMNKYEGIQSFLEGSKTTAFLVVRNDSIIFEDYPNGKQSDDITQIFSITKPLTVSLLSEALDEDRISTVHTPVNQYFPIRKRGERSKDLTLSHLANMQSGFNHNDYWRWVRVVRFYHSKNADNYISKVKIIRRPGKKYRYKSIDTQVLGICMEKIFEEDDLMDRFVSLYWNNIGPEHSGYFSIDHLESDNLKYYGGLNVSARDLAKIGKIYLNDGVFEEKQVLNKEWMNYIQDTTNHVGRFDYCMGWYFDEMAEGRNVFYGSGFNGQLLVINKDTNTVIVRMGESKDGHEWFHILSELSTLF
ncbi:MAG: serine hydrolase [Bacteroidetes bacterium]|nr:serine hydrolase [Bacteroidota bacterium]